MSVENVKKFYEALKNDAALAGELKTASDELNREAAKKALELVAEFARKKGFDVTAEALKAYETQAQELTEEELEQVNAAGWAYCVLLGLGWDGAKSYCKVIGFGLVG